MLILLGPSPRPFNFHGGIELCKRTLQVLILITLVLQFLCLLGSNPLAANELISSSKCLMVRMTETGASIATVCVGFDSDETIAPVAKLIMLCTLLALITAQEWTVRQMLLKNAFGMLIYGKLYP
ncbi:hypothetical protein AMTR_s00050p00209760 [Amborella trichopoda]|uniref:Uncharacterized protein n=1 Tax=Amborella trichopoda TaxID=13333 RepID=W1PXF9_AMBTC|nr:hypothetical protein AMTR_s00050p00209760 [Amborella trichopoda]